ncbi:uncharacterized protein LOC112177215 [Rosa chinensis]|uniref:uncharacterized protein LOC112177215 n=1 Tax=Rosa chinensis TaxID=74649 RepID=UPI000D089C61|nr:uncharacterized protein LOC112177215 [Rosa chinensis]
MAGYPYHSPPPPPSPPCNGTTSPILPPPPPPPPPSPPCNTTTTPKLQPPPPPACTCNNLPPPTLPSPPPPSHYYPPVHSPPPPSPSHPSPLSPPPPPFNYSPPVLPPTSSPSPPPPSPPSSYFPSPQPTPSPPSPDYSPPPPSQSPSPWAIPPNHYNSISPNYYDSIAPGPQFASPSNGQRTAIVTAFVSLGGVFFLAFIVIGLLSMAMKKKLPRWPRRGQPDSPVERQENVHNFERIPPGKPTEHRIEVVDDDPDRKLVESSNVQRVAPPDEGAGHTVEQALHQTSNPSGTDKMSSDTKLSKPPGEESVTDNMDASEDADKGKLEGNCKPLDDDHSVTDNADASPEVEKESNEDGKESNDSRKKLRLPKKKKNGKEKHSGVGQALKAAGTLDLDEAEQSQDGDNDEEQVNESKDNTDAPEDADEGKLDKGNSKPPGEKSVTHNMDAPEDAEEGKLDEGNNKRLDLDDHSATDNADASPEVENEPNEVGKEQNDAKKKLSLPKKKKKGREKHSGISQQLLKASGTLDLDEAEQSQDGDNDEEQVNESKDNTDSLEDADEGKLDEGNSKPPGEKSVTHNMDAPEDAEEGKLDEGNSKRLDDHNATDNADASPEVENEPNEVGKEPNDAEKKLRLLKKKKKGREKHSGISQQLLKAAGTLEAEQSQDGDNDEEQVNESKDNTDAPEDADEGKLDEGNSKPPGEKSVTHNMDAPEDAEEGKLDEGNSKRLDDHNATDNADASPEVENEPNEVGKEPNDAEKKLHLPKKKKKGREKHSGISQQLLNAAGTLDLDGAEQSQDGDEEQVNESEDNMDAPEDADEGKLDEGMPHGEKSVTHNMDAPEDEEEAKLDESNSKRLDDHSVTDNADASPDVEKESNEVGKEPNDAEKKLCLPKKKNKGREKHSGISQQILKAAGTLDQDEAEQSQDGDNDGEQVNESKDNTDAPEDADEGKLDEGNSKPHGEKSVTHNMDAPEDAEEGKLDEGNSKRLDDHSATDNADASPEVENEPNEVGKEPNDAEKKLSLPKKKKNGKEKHSGISQVLKVAGTFDLDKAEQSQDGDNNEEQVNKLEQSVTDNMDTPEDTDEGKLDVGNIKPPSERSVTDNMDAVDEGKLDEGNSKPLDDHSVTDNADASPDMVEEFNEVGKESNDSKKKPRLPMKKEKGKEKYSGISQVLKAAGTFDLGEAEQSQDGDNDEEQINESEHRDDGKELISGGSNNADEKVEQPNADEQEPDELHGKPPSHHTNNADFAQDVEEGSSPVQDKSKDSKNKLGLPKKESSRSSSSVKKGKEKTSQICEVLNTASNFDLDGAIESQDDNNDAAEVQRLETHNHNEELNSSGSNNAAEEVEPQSNADEDELDAHHHKPLNNQSENDDGGAAQDVEQESNAVEEESNGRSHKPLNNQSETNNEGATQDVEKAHAAENDSTDSKRKSRTPKKDKASSSRGHPQGKIQHSRFDQVLNATGNIYPDGAAQSQEDDNDEAEVQELEFQHDGEEMNLGGSKNVDEGVERQSDKHEKESDEHHGKPLINQSESENTEAAQDVEKEPHEGKEKPYGLEQKSYESEERSLQTKNPSGRPSGKQKPFKFGQALNIPSNVDLDGAVKSQEDDNRKAEVQESEPQEDGGDLNLGGPNNANEEVELPSNVDEEISDGPLCNEIESDDIEVTQDVEQQSDAVKRRLINPKETFFQKKKHSSRLTGKQKASIVGQVSNAASNVDLDGGVQSQDNDTDEVEVHEPEPQNDFEELEVGAAKKDPRGQQTPTRARSREEPLNLEQLISTASGNDSSTAMVSLDNEEGIVEELDPFASARGGKQALSEAKVPDLTQILTVTNVDDSSEELKSVGGDDYKNDKAKAHELKFGGSKKDSRGRQHRTQVREEVKLFNLEKIGTAASGSDPAKALVSLDDEDDRVQESEPIASNVDSYFRQPLSSARGIDQSPNLVQMLTATIDNNDPNVELKSLEDGDYKGKKAEVYELSKDSRRIKGHTMGARTRIEPPNLDQIVTARIGDDLGKGLESLGGNQEGESDKDGSNKDVPGSGQTNRGTQQLPNLVQILTATNEGDPNPELEFCEDDKELESDSNKDLSIQEPSPGEIEPSTDDQSVLVSVDDDPDVLQFHDNEYDEEQAESNKDGRTGKPLSRPPTTSLRGKRRD